FTLPLRLATAPSPDDGAEPRFEGLQVLTIGLTALNPDPRPWLRNWGAAVSTAEDATAAIGLAARAAGRGQPFRLVLVRQSAAAMEVQPLANVLRSLPGFADTKVVALAGQPLAAAPDLAANLVEPVCQSALFDTMVTLFGAQADPVSSRPAEPRLVAGRPARVLLAEDNLTNQRVARRVLEKAGYSVDVANNGVEAVEAVRQQDYDLVLMDVQMPELDGMAATAAIRALDGPKAAVPIIALTANAMRGDAERYLAAGMSDYVSKPIDRARLLSLVAQWAGRTALVSV
ncbi:MAG: response regulator, partial [Rhodospirillales bacterium]|nr:response regulator [Rhodospirillales bacterium]